MLANIVTTLIIALLILGGGAFSYRKVTKVWKADRERAIASEAALLAAITATTASAANSRRTPLKGQHPTSAASLSQPDPPLPRPVTPGFLPGSSARSATPTVAPAQTGQRDVEDDIRAFLGTHPPAEPTAASAPGLADATFGKDLAHTTAHAVAQAMRQAADRIEAAAHGETSSQERAGRALRVATQAVQELPLALLIDVASPGSTPSAD